MSHRLRPLRPIILFCAAAAMAGPVAAQQPATPQAAPPPSAQAPTTHWDAWPRWLLCCMGTIPTHKLTGVVVAAGARNAAKTMP